jgi:FMN phosphatase YigB (HAD superfamily)
MEWGGVGVDRFKYDLVTAYETSHATKAHPAYYREILHVLGRQPEECLMVGDNWEWDVVCAAEVGIAGFWIAAKGESPPTTEIEAVGQGSLDELLLLAENGGLEECLVDDRKAEVAR